MAIVKQRFTITYERSVNTDNGEILETNIVSSSDPKSVIPITDTDTEPKVYLENNKLRLNSLAVNLLQVKVGDRIDVQYTDTNPIIGLSISFGNPEGGTKLTKAMTLSFKGKRAEALQRYGNEFKLIQSGNQFILETNSPKELIPVNPVINIDDIDFLTDDLLDDSSEVKSSMFQL